MKKERFKNCLIVCENKEKILRFFEYEIVSNTMKLLTGLILSIFLYGTAHTQGLKPIIGAEYKTEADIKTGASQMERYLPLLKGKRVALIANNTSLVKGTHLVDTLLKAGVDIVKVFGPEHGFRGNAPAGKYVPGERDAKTGIAVVSLYGSSKKPSPEQMAGIDIMVFDIQDVGTRFYTYISTMSYCMEAAAEQNIPFLVLDRPNPNGHFVDGPVLEKGFETFVGLHPVPIVHGLTVGEYAQMANAEGWLKGGKKVDLKVIPCLNYTHSDFYELPEKPSPNLNSQASIYLYPTLCLFEGTALSVGRGTDKPFRVIGYPGWKDAPFSFTPQPMPGASDNPKYKGQVCNGYDLTEFAEEFLKNSGKLYLFWVMDAYQRYPAKDKFFTSYFNTLAGNAKLKEQIKSGVSEQEIRKSWEPALSQFKEKRKKYLLYPDFE
jgi:uncharacterized protein YbbC (DUF1343 family)